MDQVMCSKSHSQSAVTHLGLDFRPIGVQHLTQKIGPSWGTLSKKMASGSKSETQERSDRGEGRAQVTSKASFDWERDGNWREVCEFLWF